MDENKQAMIAADEFDVDTMMVMFQELRAKQIRAEAEGRDGLSPENAGVHRGRQGAGHHALPLSGTSKRRWGSARWT